MLSQTRIEELLDYASCYGEFDENTSNGTTSSLSDQPMDDARRAAIVAYKTVLGQLSDDLAMSMTQQRGPVVRAAQVIADKEREIAKLQERIAKLQERIAALEALRPHWAQGYTSDGVAAQVTTAALNGLWGLLGVKNQTEAMDKLRALVNAEPAPFDDKYLGDGNSTHVVAEPDTGGLVGRKLSASVCRSGTLSSRRHR